MSTEPAEHIVLDMFNLGVAMMELNDDGAKIWSDEESEQMTWEDLTYLRDWLIETLKGRA